ncbi:Dihydrodipicolinate reductase [Phytophthora infestans]|uniref:Dihydrodipicolinate reductase n=1 Tax=Phytophthora infestans TaxID=4787 RepID=A0A833WDR5_PHYIN|nr:Dihydrodipicolinate reductase [Phytophthora infestans]
MGDYGQYDVPKADEMINFKVGQPAPAMLPLDKIREAATLKFAETDPMFLQYGVIKGYPKFRKTLAEFLTKGYQHESGDLVFMEEPSYFLALSIMKDFKINVRQIRMEEDGLDIDELERLLQRGIVPKMLYTIPTCHNPRGEHSALRSFLQDPGSCSSSGLDPGLSQASEQDRGCGQLDSSGGISPVISGIVHAAIASGLQQEHLDTTVQTLWGRADALMKELKACLPEGVTFEVPDGGYFVLVRLPEGLNANDLLPIAQKHKVMFLPGTSFSSNMKNFLRLSFSWYDFPDMQLGARRLADAIREYQEIFAAQKKSEEASVTSAGQGVRVAVHGHDGRLGSLIVTELSKTDNDASFAGAIVTRLETGKVIAYLREQKDAGKINKLPALVVGTTGALPMEDLEAYSKLAPVALRSNFSVGVPLVSELIKAAAFKLPTEGWNVEVTEIHHTKKLDAPSGTAKTLVKSLAATGAACLGETGQAPARTLCVWATRSASTLCYLLARRAH